MALTPVSDALALILKDVAALPGESVPIANAAGRVLAADLFALRTQPPFPASAMDGYAVRAADTNGGQKLRVTGIVQAGQVFDGMVRQGEAVRIFTGAPVPDGADAILIQENAQAAGDGFITATQPVAPGKSVRRAGMDFAEGDRILERGRVLDPAALSLAAAANHAQVHVVRQPIVAILSTGDELLPPGSVTGPGQIIASNAYAIDALARQHGATVLALGIAPDRKDAIAAALAAASRADILVTLGGASVGDHDLVRGVFMEAGVALDFWKIAMRPGKPMMTGTLDGLRILGLPGNPVSSIVCAHLFLVPLLRRLGGLPDVRQTEAAVIGADMAENDEREDYVRAITSTENGQMIVTPFTVQDSSMLMTLAAADALLIRPAHAPAAKAGDPCRFLRLR